MMGNARFTRVGLTCAAVAAMLGIGGCTGSDPLDEASATIRVRFEALSPVTTGRFDKVRLALNAVDIVALDAIPNQVNPAPYALVARSLPLDLTDGTDRTVLETRIPAGRYRVTNVLIGSPDAPVMLDSDFTSPPADFGTCVDHTASLTGSVSYAIAPPVPDLIVEASGAGTVDLRLTIDASAFAAAFQSGFTCFGCPNFEDPPPPACTPSFSFDPAPVNAIFPSIVTFSN